MWLSGLILLMVLTAVKSSEAELIVEAAFQGRCGHNSPCEQLCYEIHDGMYECDCTEGYELNKNGYSCQEINSTFQPNSDSSSKDDEDVFYQKGVSFSAKLAANGEMSLSLLKLSSSSLSLSPLSSSSSSSSSSGSFTQVDSDSESADDDNNENISSNTMDDNISSSDSSIEILDYKNIVPENFENYNDNNNNYYYNYYKNNNHNQNNKTVYNLNNYNNITYNNNNNENLLLLLNMKKNENSDNNNNNNNNNYHNDNNIKHNFSYNINKNSNENHNGLFHVRKNSMMTITSDDNNDNDNYDDNIQFKLGPIITTTSAPKLSTTTITTDTTLIMSSSTTMQSEIFNEIEEDDNYYLKQDMSIYDDVNNNKLNLRQYNPNTYQNIAIDNNSNINKQTKHKLQQLQQFEKNHQLDSDDEKIISKKQYPISTNININNTMINTTSFIAPSSYIDITSIKFLKANKKNSKINDEFKINTNTISTTLITPLENKMKLHNNNATSTTDSIKITTREPCLLDCGPEGLCDYVDGDKSMRCLCPFGKTGKGCTEDSKINIPRFTKKSWLAFPALRGAYKHVQLRVEFRPESFDGIILLTGERDDLTGDFMALLIHLGFIEFWFDCGSGTGSVRSRETVLLNQWNTVTIYRHRWDAWLVLNHGTRVQGRSKGLFSRITFREPVFLGGTGNVTGLTSRLPVSDGMIGCIRRFSANEHEYKFIGHPFGDLTNGFGIQDCTTDKCVKYPCQHGGKCLPSDQGAVCLCPLGFSGDLCEMRLDLQVPSFNGSSYLRYAPLGDSASIWLELLVIIKPHQQNGLLLYSGHEGYGDYIALSLNNSFVEFAFDLGSGPALVRSEFPISMAQWHTIKISRTARLAVLKIDQLPEVMTISSNGFWHLSLPHSLFLGGVHGVKNLPLDLKNKQSFVGCIQKVIINGRILSIISEALGGTNVDNCPHACVAKPCGQLAQCVPLLDNYECRCNPFNAQCNQAEEVSLKRIIINDDNSNNNNNNNNKQTFNKNYSINSYVDGYCNDNNNNNNKNNNNNRNKNNNNRNKNNSGNDNYYNKKSNDNNDKDDYNDKYMNDDIVNMHLTTSNPEINKNKLQELSNIGYISVQEKNSSFSSSLPLLSSNYMAQRYAGNHLKKSEYYHHHNHNHHNHHYHHQHHYDTLHNKENKTKEKEKKKISKQLKKRKHIHHKKNHQNKNQYLRISTINDDTANIAIVEKPTVKEHTKQFNIINLNDDIEVGKFVDENVHDVTSTIKNSDENYHHHVKHKNHKNLTKISIKIKEDYNSGKEINSFSNENDYQIKELIQDMKRILKNSTELKSKDTFRPGIYKKNLGACFIGTDSYFHYNDAETMSQIISYKIDLNLRFKTHSNYGVILWTGRQSALSNDDFLSLGIEQGYLHFRYNLGSGETNILFNATKVSDGLWHRVRAMRNLQEGSLEVDGKKSVIQRSPGRLRQLNTDTGLYVGGLPNASYYTRQRYYSGITGCISEVILAGELRLNLDPAILGTSHNVEVGTL